MCGIFAYAGRPLSTERAHLMRAALGAARRGPHGYGWTGRTPGGQNFVRRGLGPLNPRELAAVSNEITVMLGHTRLATVGRYDDVRGLQPLLAAATLPAHASTIPHAVVHNGNVYNADQLADRAVTDSHAVALAYARLRLDTDPATALKEIVDRAEQHAWVIVVLDTDGQLYGHRHRHPLFTCTDPAGNGVYWSSQPCCGTARPLPELTVFTTGV